MDLPIILYMIYRMVSAQQMNFLRETAKCFQNDTISHLEVDMTNNEHPLNT